MSKHQLHDRDDGLQHCKVCNGAEGSLPVNCPGRRMTEAEELAVFSGEADFVHGALIRAQVFSVRADEFQLVIGESVLRPTWRTKGPALAGRAVELRRLEARPPAAPPPPDGPRGAPRPPAASRPNPKSNKAPWSSGPLSTASPANRICDGPLRGSEDANPLSLLNNSAVLSPASIVTYSANGVGSMSQSMTRR